MAAAKSVHRITESHAGYVSRVVKGDVPDGVRFGRGMGGVLVTIPRGGSLGVKMALQAHGFAFRAMGRQFAPPGGSALLVYSHLR